MAGSVRTQERCPKCHGAFKRQLMAVRGRRKVEERVELVCAPCGTRPTRYFVDGRFIRDDHGEVGYIFTDGKGNPIESHKDAEEILLAIRKEIREGTFLSTRWNKKARGQYAVSVAAEDWLKHLEQTYKSSYPYHSRHFFTKYISPDPIGGADIRRIRGLDIIKFRERLSGLGISENTIRSILTALRSCLSWLRRQDVIDRVPAFPVLSSVPRAYTGWIEPEDQARVIALLREDMRLMVETMFALGARPGEAAALKIRDLRDGAVRVERALDADREPKKTKTGVLSEKVISEDLFRRLEDSCRDRLPEAFLFTNRAGRPFHVRQVSWHWRKAADKAGVKACLYVASRHSRVSQLRMELERRVADQLRAELAHRTSTITLKHYVRERE